MQNKKIILFYDGACGFCQKVIQLSTKWINDTNVYFAPLEGETFDKLSKENKSIPQNNNAILLLKNNNVFIASEAFFKLAKHFKKPYYFLYLFKFLPLFISDFFYKIIAKYRYNIFGKVNHCLLPSEEIRKKFLL